mmetsp:Transcript_20156/g.24926  ORF Transcript_20156/g.24926 Transcript_20156/m.24926 type:complete len:144 (-) Transcript_20156:230-661(-)|eukprot:CAMPEP_0172497168 /NCGR_PEP_ID=MMETSP1066-20121228/96206_1 /TAXON_ID=671091 /ORGANISM="Coscinodiscus wailesii, Strain CCMP2513" /LENGTH=143 /DNA_ID=CAMNT_0013269795 /DNA_START=153 /DNA_END=584 /DNA_ORIENTATION=-
MRLLTHNTLRNNSAEACARKNGGFPLKITATEVRVDDCIDDNEGGNYDDERQIAFVKNILGILDWPALVQGAKDMGLSTLPSQLTQELADDSEFLKALHHVLMNVHLVRGVLTCPDTGREFAVRDGIPEFMLEEEECENVRIK